MLDRCLPKNGPETINFNGAPGMNIRITFNFSEHHSALNFHSAKIFTTKEKKENIFSIIFDDKK